MRKIIDELKAIGINDGAVLIQKLEESEILAYEKDINNMPIFKTVTDDMKKTIEMIEKSDEVKVFVIITGTYNVCGEIMKMEAYLTYPIDESEEYFYKLSGGKYACFSYVKNLTDDGCSEYGDVIVKPENNILVRKG